MIDFINKNQGFFIVILTLVYVVATIGLFWNSIKSNKLNITSLQNLSRPYIIIDLHTNQSLLYLHLRNISE